METVGRDMEVLFTDMLGVALPSEYHANSNSGSSVQDKTRQYLAQLDPETRRQFSSSGVAEWESVLGSWGSASGSALAGTAHQAAVARPHPLLAHGPEAKAPGWGSMPGPGPTAGGASMATRTPTPGRWRSTRPLPRSRP